MSEVQRLKARIDALERMLAELERLLMQTQQDRLDHKANMRRSLHCRI
jgi:hypothetical protein